MVKAAKVKLVRRQQSGGGLISIIEQGGFGAAKAASDAGAAGIKTKSPRRISFQGRLMEWKISWNGHNKAEVPG